MNFRDECAAELGRSLLLAMLAALLADAAARCTTSRATSLIKRADSFRRRHVRRGHWWPARFPGAIRRSWATRRAEHFDTGKVAGVLAEALPFPVDRSVLERGQDRYRIFCTPCHGELGNGRGMIVRRGFNPPPIFPQRRDAEEARRPLLRRDDSRLRHDVFVCVTHSCQGPLGDRGLHPGAAIEPACPGRGASCGRPGPARGESLDEPGDRAGA